MRLDVKVGDYVEWLGPDGQILLEGEVRQVIAVSKEYLWLENDNSGPWFNHEGNFKKVSST
jgi:hypothetical protein